MAYNPNIHHRKSIRLKGYDYSQAGLYFVTICCQNRTCLFGEITCRNETETGHSNAQMILNEAGKMIEKWYYELENKFPDIRCHEMITMPNHFHCIIENTGTDRGICPDDGLGKNPIQNGQPNGDIISGDIPNIISGINPDIIAGDNSQSLSGEHKGSPLPRVLQWFKTMTTNEYIRGVKTLNWTPFDRKLWQRNYWERIIRNQNEYQSISKYIIRNPQNWHDDKFKT